MLIAFNKPYGVLSQFTAEVPGQSTLAGFKFPAQVYPIGRLDADSEGLLLLSDEKHLVDALLNPRHQHPRTYHVQVEGEPTTEALARLSAGGIALRGHTTLPCTAVTCDPQPNYPPREPPIRSRASIPTCWLALTLIEGKNRQVRRMTAAVGHPTLRLIRVAIGRLMLNNLVPGTWRELDAQDRALLLPRISHTFRDETRRFPDVAKRAP